MTGGVLQAIKKDGGGQGTGQAGGSRSLRAWLWRHARNEDLGRTRKQQSPKVTGCRAAVAMRSRGMQPVLLSEEGYLECITPTFTAGHTYFVFQHRHLIRRTPATFGDDFAGRPRPRRRVRTRACGNAVNPLRP